MAKKTRSQKIIADLRRKIKANRSSYQKVETKNNPKQIQPTNPSNFSYKFEKNNEQPVSLGSVVKVDNLDLIKKDLYKTLFFSLIVTGIILVLYWSLEVQKIGFLTKILPS